MKSIKTTFFLTFSFCFAFTVKDQIQTEFEGVITYSHQVTSISNDYNVERDYGYIGKQSNFYYKAGKYKWLNQNGFMQMENYKFCNAQY